MMKQTKQNKRKDIVGWLIYTAASSCLLSHSVCFLDYWGGCHLRVLEPTPTGAL